ncbi:MAG: biotin transporter BioY [Deltaproteobacteria bacterium]|nr:biotin transporter BioY [Deltaproteobacteria bacterium]
MPITLQTFVLYVGAAALGRHYAVLMISGYFAMGIAGAPIFSRGASGIAPLLGPTGGYLAGFFLAALLVGYLAPRARSAGRLAGVLLLASCAIYLCGSWRLAQVLQKGVLEVLPLGVYPFILGDIAKITASITLIQAGRRWFAKKRAISAN